MIPNPTRVRHSTLASGARPSNSPAAHQYATSYVVASQQLRVSQLGAWLARQKPLYWWKIIVGGIAAWIFAATTLPAHAGLNGVPAILFLAAATVPFAFVAFCYEHGGQPRAPLPLIALALAAGGVLALAVGAFLDSVFASGNSWLGGFGAGVAEESAKAMVVLIFALTASVRARLPHRLHGLVIGSAVGAGFAVMETMGYGLTSWVSALAQGQNLSTALLAANHELATRMLLAAFGHMCWSALVGAAIWRDDPSPRLRPTLGTILSGNVLTAYGMAVTLHGLWDGSINANLGPILQLGPLTLPAFDALLIGPLGLLMLSFFFFDAYQRSHLVAGTPVRPLAEALPAYLHLALRGFNSTPQPALTVPSGYAAPMEPPQPVPMSRGERLPRDLRPVAPFQPAPSMLPVTVPLRDRAPASATTPVTSHRSTGSAELFRS